ncbi:MAG: exopolysaccharide biosynthesis polyprenyl glycosylphosphotransferase, partial [Prevotellaceae bacterium]|nr:exopolysaccharide biosynthesis polyprenyl glycosylphosphotransferase [Prevotellaceae bacterium]
MSQYINSADNTIKIWVILGDFAILNIIFAIVSMGLYAPEGATVWMGHAHSLLYFNLALAVSEWLHQPTVGQRLTAIKRQLAGISMLVLTHAILLTALFYATGYPGPLIAMILTLAAAEWVVLTATRMSETGWAGHTRMAERNIQNVVFIGDSTAGRLLYGKLQRASASGYQLLGYYGDQAHSTDHQDDPTVTANYLGTVADFFAQHPDGGDVSTGVNCLFCCLPLHDTDTIERLIRFCYTHTIHFYYVPSVCNDFQLRLKPERMGETLLYTSYREPLLYSPNRVVKQVADVVISAVVCMALIPLLPFIALGIKMQSRGPVFFSQARTGLNGHTFTCYKFRTMHLNREQDTLQATENDPRIFPFGAFLRKTYMDELPQFFNVLRGDMSIIGPRPHMLYHTQLYSKLIDKYMVRHFYKPGITGYAQ